MMNHVYVKRNEDLKFSKALQGGRTAFGRLPLDFWKSSVYFTKYSSAVFHSEWVMGDLTLFGLDSDNWFP